MRAGSAKRRPSNSLFTRWSRCSVMPEATRSSARNAMPRIRMYLLRRHIRRFYPAKYGFPVAADPVLPVKDMPADLGDAALFLRPFRLDVGGVEKQRAAKLRRVLLVVHRLRHPARPLPGLAFGLGQPGELGPRKSAHVAPAQRIPILLVDHVAHRARKMARGPAVHRHFRHRVLAGERLAARLEIHVAREAGEILRL